MIFYLGTGYAAWLDPSYHGWSLTEAGPMPLFVSMSTVARRRKWSTEQVPWALDCGAFSAIASGEPPPNVDSVVNSWRQIRDRGGAPSWVVSPDWPAHSIALRLGGYTVDEAIERTVDNYLAAVSAAAFPVALVVTGDTIDDFVRCADAYRDAGVVLADAHLVAFGALFDATPGKLAVIADLAADLRVRAHLLGVKGSRLRSVIGKAPESIFSTDSMGWSAAARHGQIRLSECSHTGDCRNCIRYASRWGAAQVNAGSTFQPTLL